MQRLAPPTSGHGADGRSVFNGESTGACAASISEEMNAPCSPSGTRCGIRILASGVLLIVCAS